MQHIFIYLSNDYKTYFWSIAWSRSFFLVVFFTSFLNLTFFLGRKVISSIFLNLPYFLGRERSEEGNLHVRLYCIDKFKDLVASTRLEARDLKKKQFSEHPV